MNHDRIDEILEQWKHESPQLDVPAIAVIGRVLRIARLLEKHRESVLAEYGLVWSFDMLATLRRQGPPYQLKLTDLCELLMLVETQSGRIEVESSLRQGSTFRFCLLLAEC
jgi:hypothetical protein